MNYLKIITLILLLSTVYAKLYSQYITVDIEIFVDDDPSEVNWQIFDITNNTYLFDADRQQAIFPLTQSNALYSIKGLAIPVSNGNYSSNCFKFEIIDSGKDGLGTRGYYIVSVDGNEIASYVRDFFTDETAHYFGNCAGTYVEQIGLSCNNAQQIYANEMQHQSTENFWYTYKPFEDGIYSMNTCETLDTASNAIDTELWIYDFCPDSLYSGPVGALYYNDNDSQCSPGAGFPIVLLQANTTYYIRVKNKTPGLTEDINLQIVKIPDFLGCTDETACNYNPFANESDGSCFYNANCAPDLQLSQTTFENSIYLDTIEVVDNCLIEESCVSGLGERAVVRFSTEIANVGDVDYIIGFPEEKSPIFSKDNCHQHWHQLGYAEYLLYAGAGLPEPIGFKNGFCVLDVACEDTTALPKYSCNVMGITAGCYDIYEAAYECQWVDVTDVPDGDYTLVARINWNRLPDITGKRESNYLNNWVQVCINLDRTSGALQLTIIEDCADYKDCAGNTFGQAVVDCAGNCGGFAHFGDINNTGLVDALDVDDYVLASAMNSLSTTNCNDLNADGNISLFDAALLQECLETYAITDENTIHQHCIFPAGINSNDTVELKLSKFDETEQFFEIYYKSELATIKGMQINIAGADIAFSELSNGGIENFILENSNTIVSLLVKDSSLVASNLFLPLVKIHYNNITDAEICINEIVDVVDENYFKTKAIISGNCLETNYTSTSSYAISTIKVYPSIASDYINVNGAIPPNTTFIISNVYGTTVQSGLLYENNKITIDINSLGSGIYFLTLPLNNKQSFNQKFIKI